jgi:drug/metabolite transporter (DMT)-like permease
MSRKTIFYKLLFYGSLAALFFSITFVLNRTMALDSDHWYWIAALRYIYVFLLLSIIIFIWKGKTFLFNTYNIFKNNFFFWLFSGGIGFGVFYLALSYAASFSPGWVVATTWQLTIIFTPIVLWFLGYKISKRIFFYMIMIFLAVALVNINEFGSLQEIPLIGILAISIAAISYPLGNTVAEYAISGKHKYIKRIEDKELSFIFSRILIMTLGAFPILFFVGIAISPPPPTGQQLLKVFIVAVSTGVIATSLLFYAREKIAKTGIQKTMIDSTQSLEVPFALIIEIFMLNIIFPNILGLIGIIVIVFGIYLSTKE